MEIKQHSKNLYLSKRQRNYIFNKQTQKNTYASKHIYETLQQETCLKLKNGNIKANNKVEFYSLQDFIDVYG